jgi:hypothetical protein
MVSSNTCCSENFLVSGQVHPQRRSALWTILAVVLSILAWLGKDSTLVAADLRPEQFEADFDALWSSFDQNYAYFDVKQTDWAAVRSIYRPRAREVKTRAEFVGLLEHVRVARRHGSCPGSAARFPRGEGGAATGNGGPVL